MKSPITTHVLDTSRGLPAAGVAVRLEQLTADGQWRLIGQGVANADGRILDLIEPTSLTPGHYRLTFETATYFRSFDIATFYPEVTIDFLVTDVTAHYHVPLLINPFGYTTYRGS